MRDLLKRCGGSGRLLAAAARGAGEVTADFTAYQLMRAIGDICAGAEMTDPNYDPRLTIRLLLDGCRT
ncbi:hypothetical protein [Nocardia sp. NPDC051832]|uniref:hypothetical protein n=1 Tax=Nocardia sp. NPDC051832 TaxID=3155673 RepID=UPI003413851C